MAEESGSGVVSRLARAVGNWHVRRHTGLDVAEHARLQEGNPGKAELRAMRRRQLRRLMLAMLVKDASMIYHLAEASPSDKVLLLMILGGPVATIAILTVHYLSWRRRLAQAPV